MTLITKEALHKKSPQEITTLLYEACINNLEEAKLAIQDNNFSLANEKLQKSNDILERLGAGLNYEAGIISDQLDAVYNYMAECLIKANLNKDVTIIDEVLKLLTEISSAWRKALVESKNVFPKAAKQKTNAYEQHSIYGD
ncbi:flagellar export chaperone FliS [Anaerobacillus alkalilacustris]|uniref:Flagellar secretion chaperone FliS n=1 Tax=Anaerobacillus alkalilacustris TaxID=393763 RepID=A0A1S2LXI5_9BACI|nr:flagellar export chaperone FliS [Anaerobacillus alkalilacustris]OIJ16910.1 flagellar export chaperone FliS [Anaerobacillus alkalilacustris]